MENVSVLPVRDQLLDRRGRLEREIGRAGPDASLTHLLQEVDAALARVSAGTYGLCETCHDGIEQERLIADPLIRFCLDHLPPAEQRALERDLELAASIQRALLPPPQARLNGWELAYHYRPSRIVGGDYCDYISHDNGGFHFLLGDVSGKGVAASMLVAHLHALFHALISEGLAIETLMQRASHAFCESTLPTHYATLVCGFASADGDVALCNAGHPSPLVMRRSGLESITSTGLPLGMFCMAQFGVTHLHLEPGDGLLLATDGLFEAENAAGMQYGIERLEGLAASLRHLSPAALLDACVRDLATYVNGAHYADDVTLMAVRRGRP